jgi:hypothetical protein
MIYIYNTYSENHSSKVSNDAVIPSLMPSLQLFINKLILSILYPSILKRIGAFF